MKKEVILLYGTGFKDLDLAKYTTKGRVFAFVIDKTVIQIDNQYFCLWFCIEPINKSILGIHISEK